MGKRRRSAVALNLDEAERTLYSTFSSAANSLSHLYTQAINQQKLSFQAGERHSLEKLHQWILRQHAEGSRLTLADVVSHLQKELNYGGEDAPPSPRQLQHHQSVPATTNFANAGSRTSSVSVGQTTNGHSLQYAHSHEQTKARVFLNALSSPDRRNLQSYQLAPVEGYYQNDILHAESETHNSEMICQHQNPEMHSNDFAGTSMDMQSDSPNRESYYPELPQLHGPCLLQRDL